MGRPKLFERSEVTDKALQVFWRKGYADTSLKDLETATGVFKPALYSEFGDKEGLFIACVKHYRDNYSSRLRLLSEPLGWENIESFLRSTVPNKSGQTCFEASAFARDIPIVAEKLEPLLDDQAKKIADAIKENLHAAGVKTAQLESLTENIFTIYCGLGVLGNFQSKAKLNTRITNALKFIHLSVDRS